MTRAPVWVVLVALSVPVLTSLAVPVAAEAGEKKVSLDEVPAAVRAAILKEVGEGRLVDIGLFAQQEGALYEIEMVVEGKEFDVLFSSDGKVLKRTLQGPEAEGGEPGSAAAGNAGGFQAAFDLEHRDLVPTGRNRYFILEPGYQLVLEGKEGEHTVTLAVTVLDETKRIGNVETRVVEERETVDGQLAEISRNFLAMCRQTRSVFYFGEEVDVYRNGRLIGHEGAWMHGEGNARAGMMMPGEALLGASYYQEVAPKVAMDRARIVDVNATLDTPAGKFKDCLKVQEQNPLDGEKEYKVYAPGVGLIQDEDLLLARHGFVTRGR